MSINLDIPTSAAERVRRENVRKLAREIADGSIIMDAVVRFIEQVVHEVRVETLAQATRAENSNARRMREAIVEARRRLAKGRALWNGPCVECDAVLEQALRADNDEDAIARAALKGDTQ